MFTRALVTGAGGFVGANLVRALVEKGYDVHACVRPEGDRWRLIDIVHAITVSPLEMTDTEAIKKTVHMVQPEYVFHLAHYGGNRGQNESATIRRVIVDGTAALYEACGDVPGLTAIVATGSSSEYGAKNEPMREDMRLEPNTEYGLAKAWATLYGQHMAREQGLPVTTLRFFSIYGPYEAQTRLIPAVILALLKGEQPQLSNGDAVRDFVFVTDAVDALLAAVLKSHPGEIFNIGTGVQTTLKDTVEYIAEIIGVPTPLSWGSMEQQSFDTATWRANMAHTEAILGWKAETNLHDGLRETIEWFKKHQGLYEHQ